MEYKTAKYASHTKDSLHLDSMSVDVGEVISDQLTSRIHSIENTTDEVTN